MKMSKPPKIPFEVNLGHILLQIEVNHLQPLWFIFDTGAIETILDTETARQQGLELESSNATAKGAGGKPLEVSFAKNVTFKLPGITALFQNVLAIPIGQTISSHEGREVNGLLGYDFISRFVIAVDHVGRQMQFYNPSSYRHDGSGEIMPFTLINNYPHIRAEIALPGQAPIEASLVVDTGSAASLILAAPFVEAHAFLAPGMATITNIGAGVSGIIQSAVGRIARLRFGNILIENLITEFSQSKQDGIADLLRADGVLGEEILRRYTVIWDYPQNRMILKPNKHHDDPYDDVAAGVLLKAQGADFKMIVVEAVAENSSAAQAGLRTGDRILSIDDKATEHHTLDQIYKMFSKGKDHRLFIQRGEERFMVKLTPQRIT